MEKVGLVGMLAGCAWSAAGVLGYSGMSWKPGAILSVACALWLVGHEGMPPEVIEASAVGIFLVLLFARQWLFPARRQDKRKDPRHE